MRNRIKYLATFAFILADKSLAFTKSHTKIFSPSIETKINKKETNQYCSFSLVKESFLSVPSRTHFVAKKISALSTATSSHISGNVSPYRLVIVESPSKAKTLEKILNKDLAPFSTPYLVDSCKGHIRDLPKNSKQLQSVGVCQNRKENQVLGIRTSDNSFDPTYVFLSQKKEVIKNLEEKCKISNGCKEVIFATDNDREGEAISWHLKEVLLLGDGRRGRRNIQQKYKRVLFNEITNKAIKDAFLIEDIQNKKSNDKYIQRDINMNLVVAQETRRILDRLAGFSMSPILCKKIAKGLSAGRVQSVGLNLIVDREVARMKFKAAEYWGMDAEFRLETVEDGEGTQTLKAALVKVNEQRIAIGKDFNDTGTIREGKENVLHLSEEKVHEFMKKFHENEKHIGLNNFSWAIRSIKTSCRSKAPPPPFITSTLQQESSRKLGLSAQETMSCSQSLYEAGYISYMRTDNPNLSTEAAQVIRNVVSEMYGDEYIANDCRKSLPQTKKGRKNVEEAHEAIRPALHENNFVHPSILSSKQSSNVFSNAAIRLYDLIYARTISSQMSSQILNQTSITISGTVGDDELIFRASGSQLLFPGYTSLYRTKRMNLDNTLPERICQGQKLLPTNLTAVSHNTQPPSRYSEAGFIKELERIGVGRPSTYANIISALRKCSYVGTPTAATSDIAVSGRGKKRYQSKDKLCARRAAGGDEFIGTGQGPLVPSLTAFVVCSLLEKYCYDFIDPSFTSMMEDRLDSIAKCDKDLGEAKKMMRMYLGEYYNGPNGLASLVNYIDKNVSSDEAKRAYLPTLSSSKTEFGLFVGPWGPFIKNLASNSGNPSMSTSLPLGMASDFTKITSKSLKSLVIAKEVNGVLLGEHPSTQQCIRLKISRFGAYLELGDEDFPPISTHSLPRAFGGMGGRNLNINSTNFIETFGLSFDEIVGYASLPRQVCEYKGENIEAGLGRYGPFLRYNSSYISLPSNESHFVLTISQEQAIDLVQEGIINKISKSRKGTLAELGEKKGAQVLVKEGRYGHYIKWKEIHAKLPDEYGNDPSLIPLNIAWNIVQEKSSSTANKKSKKNAKEKNGLDCSPPPKRPLSAYLHFCAEKRTEFSKEGKTFSETSKDISRMWAQIRDDKQKREQYDLIAAKEKKKYEKKKQEWQARCDTIINKDSSEYVGNVKGLSKRPRRSLTSPKRPFSAYMFFCSEKRADVMKSLPKTSKLADISKELSRLWSSTKCNPKLSKRYRDLAAKDKIRYLEEQEACRTQKILPLQHTGKMNTSNEKNQGKRSPSAHMIFCSDNRKYVLDDEGNKLTFGETVKKLAKMWKNCDTETRTKYENLAKQNKAEKKK